MGALTSILFVIALLAFLLTDKKDVERPKKDDKTNDDDLMGMYVASKFIRKGK